MPDQVNAAMQARENHITELTRETRSYFLNGALRFSPRLIDEQRRKYEEAMAKKIEDYEEGRLSLGGFCEALKREIEPLRKLYHIMRSHPKQPNQAN